MSDVFQFQTDDDGDINIVNGIAELTNTLQTAVYLSLFGGNTDADGSSDSTLGWWGNLDETDSARGYISKTQNLLTNIEATPSNLNRIEDAVSSDLEWLSGDKDIAIDVSIPGLNKLTITINIDGETVIFEEVPA